MNLKSTGTFKNGKHGLNCVSYLILTSLQTVSTCLENTKKMPSEAGGALTARRTFETVI